LRYGLLLKFVTIRIELIGHFIYGYPILICLSSIFLPAKVASDVVTTAFALAKTMRKVPVRAGVCDGFIGNRILAVYKQVADYMMEDGVLVLEIGHGADAFADAFPDLDPVWLSTAAAEDQILLLRREQLDRAS